MGQKPRIIWEASIEAETVDDLVDLDDDEVTAKKRLRVDIRLIGASWGTDTTFFYVDLWADKGSWQRLFFGRHWDVNSSHVLASYELEEGEVLNFAARGNHSITSWQWGPYYFTRDNPANIEVLRNGEVAPQLDPVYEIQSSVEDHLSPYISAQGRINIGKRDLIYLWDYNNPGGFGWDLQDTIVIVTFTAVE